MKTRIKKISTLLVITLFTFVMHAQVEKKTSRIMKKTNGDVEDIKGVEHAKLVGVSGWPAFNELVDGMKKVNMQDYASTNKVIKSLKTPTSQLLSTRPDWMNTEEINEDISDFQQQFSEFIEADTTSEKSYFAELEEINEKFEDLREEINETYVDYKKGKSAKKIRDGKMKNNK